MPLVTCCHLFYGRLEGDLVGELAHLGGFRAQLRGGLVGLTGALGFKPVALLLSPLVVVHGDSPATSQQLDQKSEPDDMAHGFQSAEA